MELRPRFLGRLGVADAVTVGNAMLGFAATAAVLVDVSLSARLILLAGIADGLDGLVARHAGSSDVGELLDSLADVASFGVAPAMLVVAVAHAAYGPAPTAPFLSAVAIAALFVGMAVVRLALYTTNDVDDRETEGVQSTLAATLLAALYLAGLPGIAGAREALAFVGLAGVFTYLMVIRVTYPELTDRDALAMGAVQALAVAVPTAFSRAFPWLLAIVAVAYLLLAPRFYWR